MILNVFCVLRYNLVKKAIEKKLVKALIEVFPQLHDKIDHISSGSPLTNNFYYGTTQGEVNMKKFYHSYILTLNYQVYGLSHNLSRFSDKFDWLLRPKQEIKGLYLTGQDVICDGVVGAMATGVLTAMTLDIRVLLDLFTTYVVKYM